MIINRVELNNFGPYHGDVVVDLSVSKGAPVVLIHGENERGKTSLANAVRWCLYGHARGRGGRDLRTVSLMNSEALDLGQFNMKVRLFFEHEGKHYVLTRHVQAIRRPAWDHELDILLSLEINGTVQPVADIRDIISSILHEDISRFFFFDGEMLNEYEDLLNDPDRAPALVRRSIEEILGLPALERAKLDFGYLRIDTEKRQLQETKRNKANEKLIRDAQQKEEEVLALDADIQQIESLKKSLEEKRASLRDERDKFVEIALEVRHLQERERELAEIDETLQKKTAEARSIVQEFWWLPLEARIDSEYSSAVASEAQEFERLRAVTGTRRDVDALRKSVDQMMCITCGQRISKDIEARLRANLASLEQVLSAQKSENRISVSDRISSLRQFTGSAKLGDVFRLETEVKRLRMRQGRIFRQIEETTRHLREHDRAEIQRVEREYDECVAQLKDAERSLASTKHSRSTTNDSLERLRQAIRSLPEANPRLAAEATMFRALETLFDRAIDTFRERVKSDVESEATHIHQMLTTEEGYGGLRINDQYGLILVNREGRIIHQRSAGSEQILALSLIGALNRCATREAPVIMDTPFGRLDLGHRANILKFAPSFGRQVVLLVQSGEFDRPRDIEYIEGKISRELKITRDGASDRSIIQPLAEGGAKHA